MQGKAYEASLIKPGRRQGLKLRLAVQLLMIMICAPAVAKAEIYKYVDADGVVTYTNIQPSSNVDYKIFKFPCYASDRQCRSVSWEKIPLNTRSFNQEIRTAANVNAVDESLIRAIIHAESAYRPDAESPKGAQGLMQLMPATAAELRVSNPFNPANNISGGARYLSMLLDEFNGNVSLAAAAYNAGSGAVRKYGGIPPYEETQEYVRRVRILYRRYQQASS
jgi:soluble lytic murein transglycosylase-like protein